MDEPSVLIVDDDVELAAVYASYLDGSFDVHVATGGTEALETIDETIDVVLLDRRMPYLTGDEVVRAIRERGLDVRVAMVTAVEPDFDLLRLGIDDYVTKPVDPDGLVGLVETLLRIAEYDVTLREYFSLASKRATLESVKSAYELDASEEYAALCEEIEAIEDDLDETLDRMTDEEIDTALRKIVTPDERDLRPSRL